MNPQAAGPLSFLGAVLGFFAYFSLILWLISRLGGWSKLAAAYRTKRELPSRYRWSFVTAKVGRGTNYGSSLRIALDQEGIYCEIQKPFGFFHPRVFVPWEDVRLTRHQFLIWRRMRFTFEKAPGQFIEIGSRTSERVLAAIHVLRPELGETLSPPVDIYELPGLKNK